MKKFILLCSSLILICCSDEEAELSIKITSFSPSSGFCRDTVTVTGLNFGKSISDNKLLLDGRLISIIEASSEHLIFVVPNLATSGKIVVRTSGLEATSETDFKVLVANSPSITKLSAIKGFPGDEIIIEGENFGDAASDVKVTFNNVQAQIKDHSPTILTVVIPESETGKIGISVKGQSIQSEEDFMVLINMNRVLENFILTNTNVPSVALTAIKDGEVIYTYGAGFFDHAKTKTPDENTLYTMSSISKLIVAIAIMQQVELGNLDIDNDIGDYIGFDVRNPNFPEKVITTKMLMQHSSSLAHPVSGEVIEEILSINNADSVIQLHPTIEDAITPGSSIYNPAIWNNVEPGTLNKNSNYGIILMGYLVEKLSGLHFNDYSKKNIFEPLGMNGTSYHYPDLDVNHVADHYAGGELLPPFSFFFYSAIMMRTSGSDWSKFMTAILNGGNRGANQILQHSSVAAMLNVITPPNNQLAYNSNIGLVWREAPTNAGWIGHTGGGFTTHITEINQESNTGYILFTNAGAIGSLIGPGGTLNVIVHKWLKQQTP